MGLRVVHGAYCGFGAMNRGAHAARIHCAALCAIQCGAVIDRGADEGQTERDVHAVAEGGVFQYRQTLIVVHRQNRIGILQIMRLEQGIGRVWALHIQTTRLRGQNRRRDHVDFLTPHVAAFARVRVQAGHQNTRLRDAKFVL